MTTMAGFVISALYTEFECWLLVFSLTLLVCLLDQRKSGTREGTDHCLWCLSGKEVRRKWDNLRTTYNRIKKTAPSGSSGAPRTTRQQWTLNRMQFIEPHTKRKESTAPPTHKVTQSIPSAGAQIWS